MSELRALYEEMVLDHNRHPRNFQRYPEGSNRHAHGFNPVCNDEFTIHLKVDQNVIHEVGFEGAGCAISTASASLMTEALQDKTIQEAETLFQNMHDMLTGACKECSKVGKLRILAGVHDFPDRIKCAALPWHTMHAALQNDDSTVCTE